MTTSEVEHAETAAEVEAPSSWLGYSWHLVRAMGRGTMAGTLEPHRYCMQCISSKFLLPVINYLGEKLAYGLGITTPDWQYAIDIYEDMQREEQEEREAEEKALKEQQREVEERLSHMEGGRTT